LESVRNRQGKFWKEIFRKARFVRGSCRTVKQLLASKSICVIQAYSLLARFGPGRRFSPPEGKTGPKGERFSDISDVLHGVTEQLKGFIAGLPVRFRGIVKTISALCGVGGDYIESLQ
jgi:hypothetical protein